MTRAEAIKIITNSFIILPRCNGKSVFAEAVNELIYSYADRQNGEWISKGCGEYRCSVCRRIVDFGDEDEAYLFDFSIKDYKFCPFCGSDMRGEK